MTHYLYDTGNNAQSVSEYKLPHLPNGWVLLKESETPIVPTEQGQAALDIPVFVVHAPSIAVETPAPAIGKQEGI